MKLVMILIFINHALKPTLILSNLKLWEVRQYLASAVSPSTQYRIRITYSGSWCCNQNVAYCVVLAYGFSGGCSDSINGSTLIGITTDSSLPPFGIIGVVGPTDCSGSLSSAQGSLSTQQSIP